MLKNTLGILTVAIVLAGCGNSSCCHGEVSEVIEDKGDSVVENIAPSAYISSTTSACQEGGTITFDGRSSADTDGYVAKYTWMIGDELASTEPMPTFTCDSIGVKKVCLSVTDDDNQTSSETCETYNVVVLPKIAPVALIADTPKFCTVGETINVNGLTSSDADGEVTQYAWTFDEQVSNLASADFTCAKEGNQELCLTVTDNDNLTDQNCTTVIGQKTPNQAPIADLNVSQLTCVEGEIVTLDASNSSDDDGEIIQYNWTPDTFTDVQNDFNCTTPGEHVVCLTVVDDKGLNSTQVCETIVVSKKANIPPVAKIVGISEECTVGDTIAADGTTSSDIDGNVTAYLWSVDDNLSVSQEAKPIFSCDENGTKTVCLTVLDNDAALSTNEECKIVTVNPLPVEAPQSIPPVAIITMGDSTGDGIYFDCSQSYDPDTIDGDNTPQNDGTIISSTWSVFKVVDGIEQPPHGNNLCQKWIGTPAGLDSMVLTLTVTDDDGESTTVTNTYTWNGTNLILVP